MSIADKLTYLNTTKQLLKTEINRVNNVLDDNSTFRSYPQELFNGYLDILNNGTDTLWSNLEKVSGNGTEVVLENVETAPMKIGLNGNTSQETTTGKNKLNLEFSNDSTSVAGLDFAHTNSSFTLKGTATGKYKIFKLKNKLPIESGKTYTLSANVYGTNPKMNITIKGYDSSYTLLFSFSASNNNGYSTTYTPNYTGELDNCDFVIESLLNGSEYDLTAEVQLEEGSTATPYEPYTNGASPNPDYPQEVKVVTGENVVSVQGKNLFTTDKIALYSSPNIVLDTIDKNNFEITSSSSHQFIVVILGKVKDLIEKTLYAKMKKSYTTTGYDELILCDIDGKNRTAIGTRNYNNDIFSCSAEITNDLDTEKYVGIRLYASGSGGVETTTYQNVMVSTEEITDYVPYSKTDYPINLVGENIFDKDNANILNAWINASTKVITSSGSNRTIWVEAEGNKTYKVKKLADTSSNGRFRVGSSPNLPVAGGTLAQAIQDDTAEEITITTSATDKYITVFCYNTNSSITLEEILSSLEIKEANVSYSEMCKIGDYQDYLYKNNGKWYKHKEIEKVVCDETLTYRKNVKSSTFYVEENIYNGCVLPKDNYTKPLIVANQLKADTGRNVWGNAVKNTIGVFVDNTSNPRLNFGDITGAELRAHLEENPLIFYAPLITPTEEEITNTTLIEQLDAIANAKSVKDKTYITQTNDGLPFVLDIQAIKEYNIE